MNLEVVCNKCGQPVEEEADGIPETCKKCLGDKKFRVWWIPNPPRQPFRKKFDTKAEAQAACELLADYDLYLGEHKIVANAGGVEERDVFGEWSEIEENL